MAASARLIDHIESRVEKGIKSPKESTPYWKLTVTFDVKDPGPAHVCGIEYTTDHWRTPQYAKARCLRVDGPYGPGGVEKWEATATFASQDLGKEIEFLLLCRDNKGDNDVAKVYHTNHGDLFRQSLTTGTTPEPAQTIPECDHRAKAHLLAPMMLRNFATRDNQLSFNGNTSIPGSIIASPSIEPDPETDQDYRYAWVRDSALCAQEASHLDPPLVTNEMCEDIVDFFRLIQKNATAMGKPGHACFTIDGGLREWSSQNDGPALRVITVLDMCDRLSDSKREVARQLVEDDVNYLLSVHHQGTKNLWEENEGLFFFTQATQKRCFERVFADHAKLGITVDLAAVESAMTDLGKRLEDHWIENGRKYYKAKSDGGGRGSDVDASTLLGINLGELDPVGPRCLSTAAVIRDAFTVLYPINKTDMDRGGQPLIGRYPEDEYDGDMRTLPNEGHPWPVCTAALAEYYFLVARRAKQDCRIVVDDLSHRFFQQIGCTASVGTHQSGTAGFDDAVLKLVRAGKRTLDTILYHSNNLALSEQFHHDNGCEVSVRDLTWSYAAYLRAVRALAACEQT